MGASLPADLVDKLHTGVPRPSAAAARHSHPDPGTGLMEGMLPCVSGWEINYDLAVKAVKAVKAVSACWAGCESCREARPPRLSPTGPPSPDSPRRSSSRARTRACSARTLPVPPPGHGSSERHGTAYTSRAEAALRAVVLVRSRIRMSPIPPKVQPVGDRVWSPTACRLQVPPASAESRSW